MKCGGTVPTLYMGQLAQNGGIDLTPNNGFFDYNWCAGGDLGDARWYLWCPKEGDFRF